MARYSEIAYDDIDELNGWCSDAWSSTFRQLTPGRLGVRSKVLDLGGIRLNWNSFGQLLRVSDLRKGNGFSVSIALTMPKLTVVDCRDAGVGDGLLFWPGTNVRYLIPPSTTALLIDVEFDLLPWRPEEPVDPACRALPQEAHRELLSGCWKATESVRLGGAGPHAGEPASSEELRADIVSSLKAVLAPWENPIPPVDKDPQSTCEGLHLLDRVEQFLDEWDGESPPPISVIAAELNMTQRTFYRSFKRLNGVTPHRYLLIEKLHRLRSELLAEARRGGSVAAAVDRAGFSHHSRASQQYRAFFGELPSQTLARKRASHRIRHEIPSRSARFAPDSDFCCPAGAAG